MDALEIQEKVARLVFNYIKELCDQHGIGLQEAEVLFTDHCLLINPWVAANIAVDTTLLYASLINSAASTGLKEFLDLFEKVRALEGVADDRHVCTLLLEAVMTMEPIGNEA